MSERKANAVWKGDLKGGSGSYTLGSGSLGGNYSFHSRFEDGRGSNPEELLGAAHASCFSMALANMLAQAGHTPEEVRTEARVSFGKVDGGFGVTHIQLVTRVKAPDLDDDVFQEHARKAKESCPISKALGAVDIGLDASLSTPAQASD